MLPQLHNLVHPDAKVTEKNASPILAPAMLNVVRPRGMPRGHIWHVPKS